MNGVRVARQGSNTAIADTGTTLAIMEDSVVRDIYSKIPGAQYEESVGVSLKGSRQALYCRQAHTLTLTLARATSFPAAFRPRNCP